MRKYDINEQMRVIAQELTPDEMHAVAAYYGGSRKNGSACRVMPIKRIREMLC